MAKKRKPTPAPRTAQKARRRQADIPLSSAAQWLEGARAYIQDQEGKRLTDGEFAKRLGWSPTTYSNRMTGKKPLEPDHLTFVHGWMILHGFKGYADPPTSSGHSSL